MFGDKPLRPVLSLSYLGACDEGAKGGVRGDAGGQTAGAWREEELHITLQQHEG